jgi:hypothetical protein
LTDGITEAEDVQGAPFGANLEPYLRALNPVEELFLALEQFCTGTRPQDDQTVLTVDRV